MSIGEIDLKRGRRGKDFGQGFYLSADRSQAQMMVFGTERAIRLLRKIEIR